jgi:hypothetical protein
MATSRAIFTFYYQPVISQFECYSFRAALATPLCYGTSRDGGDVPGTERVLVFVPYTPVTQELCAATGPADLCSWQFCTSRAIALVSSSQGFHDVSGQVSGLLQDRCHTSIHTDHRHFGGATRGSAAAERWDRRTACSGALVFGYRRVH